MYYNINIVEYRYDLFFIVTKLYASILKEFPVSVEMSLFYSASLTRLDCRADKRIMLRKSCDRGMNTSNFENGSVIRLKIQKESAATIPIHGKTNLRTLTIYLYCLCIIYLQ